MGGKLINNCFSTTTMSILVIRPSENFNAPSDTAARTRIDFRPPASGSEQEFESFLDNYKLSIFKLKDVYYVLVKDIALLCNYPSSYQLLNKLIRRVQIPKNEFLKTTNRELNQGLFENNMIEKTDLDKKLFYIELKFLYNVTENKSVILNNESDIAIDETPSSPVLSSDNSNDEKILISQVFPQYGLVDSSLPLTHATFNTLNPLTKLHWYKMNGHFRRVYGTSLSNSERELLIKNNKFLEIGLSEDEPIDENQSDLDVKKEDDLSERERRARKPIGKPKKNITNVDPNTADLAEFILPGQGLFQEFNINHICKVPNYYITTNHMNASQTSAISNYKKPAASNFLFNENIKMSRNIQQLVFNSDNDSYHHSKYYYFKSYRGPGSGNYKDAALVNKINKIHLVDSPNQIKGGNHKIVKRTKKPISKRYNNSIKGLIHDFFTKDNVETILDEQRKYTEDYHNIEMLHNNLQFNLLINTYRDISDDTWNKYYQFKNIDFNQLTELNRIKSRELKKKELIALHHENQSKLNQTLPPSQELTELYKPDLTDRFTQPSVYQEIVNHLPVELRDDINLHLMGKDTKDYDLVPSIKKPLYNEAASSEYSNPEYLNKVEMVKLPNANSIGWENLKKYRFKH